MKSDQFYMNPEFPNKLVYPISNLYNGNVNMYEVSKKKVTRKNGWHFMFRFCLDASFRRILWALLHYNRNFQISSEKYDAFSHLDYRIVANSRQGYYSISDPFCQRSQCILSIKFQKKKGMLTLLLVYALQISTWWVKV
jgi:hypothetical protein